VQSVVNTKCSTAGGEAGDDFDTWRWTAADATRDDDDATATRDDDDATATGASGFAPNG
jgi:hypothetical protein